MSLLLVIRYGNSGFDTSRKQKVYQNIPPWHSTGLSLGINFPLSFGVQVCIDPRFDHTIFVKNVMKFKPEYILTNTSMYQGFTFEKSLKILKGKSLAFLKYPVEGGEPLTERDIANIEGVFRTHGSNARLLNGYGECECGATVTTDITTHKFSNTASGIPLPDITTVGIFDDDFNELSYGKRGNILVKTEIGMIEYFNNPEATADFFYVDENGERWSKTGDIGYMNEDGSLVVLGRKSDYSVVAKFQAAGVKNLIVTSITDYMNPLVKIIATKKGLISGKDYLDEYARTHSGLPQGMEMICLKEFAKLGSKIKETYDFEYEENKLAAYFLTGATTSQYPKCVKISADGFTKMARIYDELWFDFKPGDRNTIFIPLFYATGAIHGVHAGLFDGMTLIYKPKYDRFAFAKDLAETKANIALVAPSHVATLEESGLEDNALNHLKYIFIGGEAIMPAAMEKFRKTGERLGIQYILNGYGMTETGSMSGISDKESKDDDVTVTPVPGVEYRIVDPKTREILPDNTRGILEKKSPCATLGYFEEEKNKILFTEDGWINTGDVAVRYSNGKYRIFGRGTDCFTNDGKTYAMYDIEEQALKHPDVAEAEVIKFEINGEEYPAMVVVVKPIINSTINGIIDCSNIIEQPQKEETKESFIKYYWDLFDDYTIDIYSEAGMHELVNLFQSNIEMGKDFLCHLSIFTDFSGFIIHHTKDILNDEIIIK